MDMGKGYDDIIGCATCSLSQHLMQKLPYFILVVSSCFNPHVYLIVELWTCINSIDTLMYPYALPILHIPYFFSSHCLSCCCGNHLSRKQMITQMVNLLVGYQVGNSQENSTRSLFLIKVLFIQMVHGSVLLMFKPAL